VHGYSGKFRKDSNGKRANSHPPDDTICAQLLQTAKLNGDNWTKVTRMIDDMMLEQTPPEPGHSDSRYVTVAAQKILGIRPKDLKEARAQLRIAGRRNHDPKPPLQPDIEADPLFAGELLAGTAEAIKARCVWCAGTGQAGTPSNRSTCGQCRGTGRAEPPAAARKGAGR
jgi:hypothetical protein